MICMGILLVPTVSCPYLGIVSIIQDGPRPSISLKLDGMRLFQLQQKVLLLPGRTTEQDGATAH